VEEFFRKAAPSRHKNKKPRFEKKNDEKDLLEAFLENNPCYSVLR
jgi:hypothetical protein